MILDPSRQWECPKCGDLLEGQGPASLRWAMKNHDYWEHERPERGLPGAQQALGGGNPAPARSSPQQPAMPQDVAFYDGARLSPYDRDLLCAYYIKWNPPNGYLTLPR